MMREEIFGVYCCCVGNWKINCELHEMRMCDRDKESNKCRIRDSSKMVRIVQMSEGGQPLQCSYKSIIN